MINIDLAERVEVRSTGRLSAKGLHPLIGMLESSEVLSRFDRNRERDNRRMKFTAPQMMTVILYMEIKKLTFESLGEKLDGRGGQVVLKNLRMPRGPDGRYMRPSDAWISQFRNHEFMYFCRELEREISELVKSQSGGIRMVITGDSTPMEASRYSEWADFNPHYRIKMAKDHIVMINGVPLMHRITNGNRADNPEMRRLVEGFDGTRLNGLFLLDGSYDSWETYIDIYQRTGIVMSGNAGRNGVFHKEATWDRVLRRYNRLNKEPNFKPSSTATPDFIIRFLANHGERELAGWFLRNLDLARGRTIHSEHARIRHVCETVHRAMKRWLNFDVRGIHRRYVGAHTRQKTMFCQLLCMLFKPYEI